VSGSEGRILLVCVAAVLVLFAVVAFVPGAVPLDVAFLAAPVLAGGVLVLAGVWTGVAWLGRRARARFSELRRRDRA
jgi:hypothetical protein